MKKLMAGLIGLILVVTMAQAQKLEFAVTPSYIFPSENDTWDKAYGIEGQLRLWANDFIGIAGAGGYQRWQGKDTTSTFQDFEGVPRATTEFSGDADMVPVGASLLIRPIPKDVTQRIQLTIEGGARYVFVNSNFKGMLTDSDGVSETDKCRLDDGIIGLVAGDLGIVPVENLSIFVGGGYQFDLSKGNVDWMQENIGDNKMKGWFLRAGLTLMF